MANFRIVGSTVMSDADYMDQAAAPKLTAAPAAPGATIIPFTAIGPGKPLTIAIRHVYTGKHPSRGMLGHRGDVALVSGVKNFSAIKASARAVNLLEKGVKPNTHLVSGSAFNDGTPIIAYSAAVLDPAITLTIEMAESDGFSDDLINAVSGAFQSLAGLPVLLPYSGYLMGASTVIKLASGVADDLYQSAPAFSQTEVLNFALPGAPQAEADLRVICNPSFQADSYTYHDGQGLKDQNGTYSGDEPYVVISLDGAPNDDLRTFTPNVASAAVMQQFFNTKSGAQTAIDTLVGAVTLYSDMQYRIQADKLKQQIAQTTDPAALPALQAKYNAVVANITETVLKPAA